MDSLRDVAAILPSLAVVTVSQIAAGALSTAARLLDEHGSIATIVTRHAATGTAHLTDDLGNRVSQNAIRYASTSAIAAQQSAEALSAVTQALAAAAETVVQGATSKAQAAVHRQASSWQQYADDQALETCQRFQDAVASLAMPDTAPQQGPISNEHPNATSTASPAVTPGIVTAAAVAAAPAQPAAPAAAVAANAAPSHPRHPSTTPIAVAGNTAETAALASRRTTHKSAAPTSSFLGAADYAAVAMMHQTLADTQQRLIVKQVVTDIFRSVERRAAREELSFSSLQLKQCRRDLMDATAQLKVAAQTIAAAPGLLLGTDKPQPELQEFAKKPLKLEITAPTTSSAPGSQPPAGQTNKQAGLAAPSAAAQESSSAGGEAPGCSGADDDVNSELSDISSDFLMVDVPEFAGEI